MQKNQRWLVFAVNAVFIILLAMSLAQLSWRVFSVDANNNAKRSAPAQKITSRDEAAARLSNISELHLFGKTEVAIKTDTPIVAPETRLQLKLKGVFASSNPERAYAIISDSKNQDKSYRLGSKIVGGAILHAVYPDRVILKRNGRLETLRLSTSYDKSGMKTSIKKSKRISRTPGKVIQAPPKLKKLKQTLLEDPQQIWQQVRISPVLKDGSIKGYMVEHKDKQLMRSLNLQKGDVITAVNGKPLSDPASLYGLMNQLKTQQSLNVTIERNNQEQTIQLRM
ncbi:MAG: type II secretion system protein GspC [Gammaproteobacteria bacterium]